MYKEINDGFEREKYWYEGGVAGDLKEQWARLRRGNIGKAGKNGFENQECRLCGVEEKKLEHIWNCVEACKGIKKEWVERMNRWKGDRWGAELARWLIEKLKEEIVVELCKYMRAFANL